MSRPATLALSLLGAAALAACGPDFDDDRQSRLRKPELLSVVLDPPEAAPGEAVAASFLLADGHGALGDPGVSVWFPADLTAGGVPADLDGWLASFGLATADLVGPELRFTVPEAGVYRFDDAGLAEQPLSLLAQIGELPDDVGGDLEGLAAEMMRLVEEGRLELARRTLVVSRREVRNRNPRVGSVALLRPDGSEAPLQLARSDDADLAAARQAAADRPVLIAAGADVVFRALVEDDGDPAAIRYQWISTGGDFQGYREPDEPWEAPGYRTPGAGERDQAGQVGVEPRTDPNLYPVWLIVRDSGAPTQLGQCWAEFYVRIENPNR